MNAINRVGQKVCCVAPEQIWLIVCPSIREYPRKGQVYTVIAFEDVFGLAGVRLREIGGNSCKCAGFEDKPWLLAAFRPLDERKTDIGELQTLLNPSPALEREVAERISGVVARVAQLFGMRVGDLQRLLREPKAATYYACPICGRFDCDWTHRPTPLVPVQPELVDA